MNDKELVAQAALEYVKDKMVVGLGTGSTANYFIEGLVKKIKNENLEIKIAASSKVTAKISISKGLVTIEGTGSEEVSYPELEKLDLYVDGADEIAITDSIEVLKGRGQDLIREKLLASASKKCIIIGDNSKIVDKIGTNFPIPIEVSPIGWKITKKIIDEFSLNSSIRVDSSSKKFAFSSYGNLIIDCNFEYSNISQLSQKISDIPGVFDHGIFLNITDLAIVADKGNIKKYQFN